MLERILIAGSGGQGIVLVGRLLATVSVETIPHVTFFPAYGAEVRGGSSSCQVVLSSREIASPLTEDPDSLILMNQESMDRFLRNAGKDSLVVVNSSLCTPPPGLACVMVPATELAGRQGSDRVANFIMLGAYVSRRRIIAPSAVREGIRQLLHDKGSDVVEANIHAFNSGMQQRT
jgi:2-oxoglutarate ferredoxin oxidoreductase subunit gamma